MIARRIRAEETYPLRSRVLRPSRPLSESHYPIDDKAVHFGVFEGGDLCSVITAYAEDQPLFEGSGHWRIRGMATAPECQGRGYGAAALSALLAYAREHEIPLLWCNAREGAIPFYEKFGFKPVSDFFEIEGIGLHKVMGRSL